MYSKVESLGLFGLDGYAVEVECDTSGGLPAFDVVGLPDAAVSESRERVRAALKNSGFAFPVSRVTVNLAPADVRKTGPLYDLPILLAVLAASGQLEAPGADCAFIGELSLDGMLRRVDGALPMSIAARDAGMKKLYLPCGNASEAAVASGIEVYGVADVPSLIALLRGDKSASPQPAPEFVSRAAEYGVDFSDVRGQLAARRALEIAAAGGHNLLMIGPPGSGKSMLAKRLPTILPELTRDEAIETTKIYSVAGALPTGESLITERPFRSPHHTVSPAGLSGGGSIPRPGEISLSHNGVLFLDELPEFDKGALEILRQPVENGVVTISRVSASLTYPCRIMLIAAMNPCPCGNFGSGVKPCTCTPFAVDRYLAKVSGPLLDRIDLHVEVAAVDYESMAGKKPGESSAEIRKRVAAARATQSVRYSGLGYNVNAQIPPCDMERFCAMTDAARKALRGAFDSLGLSARAYDKVLKVSRTIADLAKSDMIDSVHVAEAVQYRALDRKYWRR